MGQESVVDYSRHVPVQNPMGKNGQRASHIDGNWEAGGLLTHIFDAFKGGCWIAEPQPGCAATGYLPSPTIDFKTGLNVGIRMCGWKTRKSAGEPQWSLLEALRMTGLWQQVRAKKCEYKKRARDLVPRCFEGVAVSFDLPRCQIQVCSCEFSPPGPPINPYTVRTAKSWRGCSLARSSTASPTVP